jgi:hypothetical protein
MTNAAADFARRLKTVELQLGIVSGAQQLTISTAGDTEDTSVVVGDALVDASDTTLAVPDLQDGVTDQDDAVSDLQFRLLQASDELDARLADAAQDLVDARETIAADMELIEQNFGADVAGLSEDVQTVIVSAGAAEQSAEYARDLAEQSVQDAANAKALAQTAQTAADQANTAALSASGLASAKGEVIVQVSAPTGTRANPANLWIDITADANGKPKNTPNRYNATTSKWEPITDQKVIDAAAVAAAAQTAAGVAKQAADTADGKAVAAQTTAYNAGQAAAAAQTTADQAKSNAAIAQTSADVAKSQALIAAGIATTKGTVYTQASAPTVVDPNGLWIDTDDGNKPYTGTQRVLDDFTATVLTSSTTADQFSVSPTGGVDGGPGMTHTATASHQTIYTATDYARGAGTTVRAKVLLGAQGTNLAGLAVFASGTSSGYQIAIDARRSASSASSMGLQIRKGGTTLVGVVLPNNEPVANRWYTVEAFVSTAGITARVFDSAGVKIGEATSTDVSVASGRMGVYAYAAARHDDFEVIEWTATQDQGIVAASQAAATAQGTADLAKTNAANAQTAADQAKSAAATAQTTADQAKSAAATAQTAADAANSQALTATGLANGKGRVIYQATAPTGANANAQNLWIRTTDNTPWTYNGSSWTQVTDKTATDAASAAAAANTAAQNAKAAADAAQATANGRPLILFSTSGPSGNAPTGSTWFQVNTAQSVVGQWQQTGSPTSPVWTARPITSEVIANLDVGKLTAGTAAIATVVAQKIAASTASFQTVNVSNLFVTTGATMQQAVIDFLFANVVMAKKITADMIDVNSLNGVTLTGTVIRSADSGKRVEIRQREIVLFGDNASAGSTTGLAIIDAVGDAGAQTDPLVWLRFGGKVQAGVRHPVAREGSTATYVSANIDAPVAAVQTMYADKLYGTAGRASVTAPDGPDYMDLLSQVGNVWAATAGRTTGNTTVQAQTNAWTVVAEDTTYFVATGQRLALQQSGGIITLPAGTWSVLVYVTGASAMTGARSYVQINDPDETQTTFFYRGYIPVGETRGSAAWQGQSDGTRRIQVQGYQTSGGSQVLTYKIIVAKI